MLRLPRQQRLALAGLLLELEDGGTDPQADEAWEQEIQARIKAVDDGTAPKHLPQSCQGAKKRLAIHFLGGLAAWRGINLRPSTDSVPDRF